MEKALGGLVVLTVLGAAVAIGALFATSTAVLYHEQKEPSGLFECLYFTGTGMDLTYSKTHCERFVTLANGVAVSQP
ncbi:hypothetical protein [Mesorhizobium amorphae]|uniref:hypothetical protein n=1 Tax=Mesorhizobium amorphae TaxID=71433 RepID=UPI00178306F4|nr:hypothetical protein [Mesorhizobium amorphae]